MIVGTIARADWCGPYVLNGRARHHGKAVGVWKLSISASAPTLLAAYGERGANGVCSVIGQVATRRIPPWSRRGRVARARAERRLGDVQRSEHVRLDEVAGIAYEYGIAIWAPR